MTDNYESDYAVVCVNAFAKNKQLKLKEAYLYLYNHKGIEFLKEFYNVEHTLSLSDAIDDLTLVCRNNGGGIL